MTKKKNTTFTLTNDNIVPKKVVTVIVHPTVTVIKDHTFIRCTSLTSIILPDLVTNIGNGAFKGCTSLTSIILPDLVTNIEERTFESCTSLASIILPNQLTNIGNGAFYYCTSLASISIPDLVTNIGGYAFKGCRSLASIILPDLVTNIGSGAFEGCTSLTSIIIPDLVTEIEDRTFNGCTSLTSIILPNQLTTIGHHAFRECTSLTSIILPDLVTNIGYAAFDRSSLTSIILSNQLTTIGFCAFKGCTSLEQRQPNGKNYHANNNAWLQQRFDDLPLHQACYNNNKNALIASSILQNLIQQHASMLTVTDAMLMTPLHILCCNPTATAEMIQILKAAQPHAASMRNVMNKTPLMMLLESKSHEKYNALHDADGQLLPLVGLLKHGLDFEALEMIMSASGNEMVLVSELQSSDEASGLLPFMYGASLRNCGLDVVYGLAMKFPDLLTRMHLESNNKTAKKESKKRKQQNSNDKHASSSKSKMNVT